MLVFISGKERDTSEVSEVVIETWNVTSNEHCSRRFSGPFAIAAMEQLFKPPILDLSGVFVSAMHTGSIRISLQDGQTDEYEILNDRLAKSHTTRGVAYVVGSPSKYS